MNESNRLSRFLLVFIFCISFPAALCRGQFLSSGSVTAQMSVVPAFVFPGSSGKLEIIIDVPPGFHIQSAHPLDPNLIAARATPSPAPGIVFSAVEYPPAKIISVSTLMSASGRLSVYEGHVIFTIPFNVSSSTASGSRHLTVSLLTQACNDQTCLIPQNQSLSADIVITADGSPATTRTSSAPAPIPPTPIPQSVSSYSSLALQQQTDIATINARPYNVTYTQLPLWLLIVFALLGGLILNLMPCVLPVVPLKVLSLLQQAEGDRRRAVLHSLVFALGVISLFGFLALAMGTYRTLTSREIIYGMQFSSPVFLITMALIVVALSLSMLNVWTIQTPRAVYAVDKPRSGWLGSYSMGLLATLLATPCSAPYLGPMLQWALVQVLPVMAIFLMLIGVGMAAPYILLAAFPGLLDRLPRPGRWTEWLKIFLGLVMLGVAVFLFLSLPTWHQIMVGFTLALVLAVACWIWGKIPTPSMEPARIWQIRSGALVGVVVAGAIVLIAFGGLNPPEYFDVSTVDNSSTAITNDLSDSSWQDFSLARLDAGLKQGRPVVVDFTAVWCINCHFVEATVLNTQPVESAFQKANAVLLRADLDDPVVMAFLSKLGGRSIPFLAVFSPDNLYQPKVLQDIYPASAVIQAVHAAES